MPATWLGQAQRSLLKAALSTVDADELTARTRNRAAVHRFRAHPRARDHLLRAVTPSGATRGVGGLSAADRADGYVEDAALPRLVQRYRLEEDPAGDVTLRTTGMLDVAGELAAGRRQVLAGLGTSADPRERAAGARLLDRALAALRG